MNNDTHGKKGVGNWELGVGEEDDGETSDSTLSSYSAHCYAEASYSTLHSALSSHSELGTLHSFPPPPHLPIPPSSISRSLYPGWC
uniref:Uncharacterized protein n=1 Tax=Desertifilum tharense IPPAS B-1220 TaxID=1781255 RepID=A0ACD5GVP7_9CYAN